MNNLTRRRAFSFILLAIPALALGQSTTSSLTQYGITWTFAQPVEYGTFVTGDYWVKPTSGSTVTISGMSPGSTEVAGRIMNGAMVNPAPDNGRKQGYDDSMKGNTYEQSLNVAYDVSATNPLNLAIGSSLVSSISVPKATARPQLTSTAILTVLGVAPAPDSFRPAYSGSDKTISFNESQLDYSKISKLSLTGTAPSMASVARKFERPWIDHIGGWVTEFTHATQNMSSYGRDVGADVSLGALMLNSDYTNAQKRDLMIGMTQLGIDLYGISKNGGEANWINNGGHASGRKFPILFAGAVLGDADMLGVSSTDRPTKIHFGEDDQTFYVTQDDINRTHNWDSKVWDQHPDTRDAEWIPYDKKHIGLPEWGIRHDADPSVSNRYWQTKYRQCCTTYVWPGEALAVLAMGLKEEWNHDAFFDYLDRFMEIMAAPTETETAGPTYRSYHDFVEAMWDEHRKDFGPSWRRNDPSDLYSSGVQE